MESNTPPNSSLGSSGQQKFYTDNEKRMHTLAVVQIVLCLLFFFPLAMFFQLLADVHFDSVNTIASGSGPAKLVGFLMHYWPSVLEVIALICAILSAMAENRDDKSKLLIASFGLSVFMLVMGLVMIFNPGVAFAIVAIIAIVGVIAAWISSQKS